MANDKTSLAVAALRSGTVIDHIPSRALFKCVKILGLETLPNQLTIGNNLHSDKLGSKGIIKIADVTLPQDVVNRIAIVAPTAVINRIQDYVVVEKTPVKIPDTVVGIVRCANPKCITNNEPMNTRFDLADPDGCLLRCHYCGVTVTGDKADIM